jgi:regulator of nucleoside diphosphate kinase
MTIEQAVAKENRTKPRIVLSAEDYGRLSALATAASSRMPELAEIERAHVLARGRLPADTVCMHSEVEFRDDTTGKIQTVTLVYPGEADISQHRVSVLTPVGTALIGLRSGHSITWETPTGQVRQLTVLSVSNARTN